MDKKKVWVWHDAPNSVYAFTDDKNIKRMFELERRLKPFKRKSYNMDEKEFEEFKRTWRGGNLSKIKIYDGNQYIDFIATEKEENGMDTECDLLHDNISTTMFHLREVNFKKKYQKLLDEVSMDVYSDTEELPFFEKDLCELYNFDEFLIFCKKYGDTIF